MKKKKHPAKMSNKEYNEFMQITLRVEEAIGNWIKKNNPEYYKNSTYYEYEQNT